MELEGYIIELQILVSTIKNNEVWDKWDREVYKDLDTAKRAITKIPRYFTNRSWLNVKSRIVPVYRGEIECKLTYKKGINTTMTIESNQDQLKQ